MVGLHQESAAAHRHDLSGACRPAHFLRELLRDDVELLRDDLGGTFAPFSRASLSAIAIACLRLVTFRPEPLFSVPFFLRRIVDSTFFEAALPYLAMCTSKGQGMQTAC